MSERWQRVAIGAALAALVAWSFAARWSVLAQSPYPLGVDGFFYPLQVRSLLEHGRLLYPASPLTFWWMAPFAAVTDPIVGAKLGAALGGALIALPAYALGARLGKSRGAGLVGAALAAMSAGSAYATIEFVKQGMGLTVALAALWLVLRALDVASRGRVLAAIAGVAAAVLTHKMAAGLVAIVAIPAALAAVHRRGSTPTEIAVAGARGPLRGRRLLYVVAAEVATVLVLLVLGLAMPQRFLSTSDLALVRGLFAGDPRWDAPALATKHGVTILLEHDALTGAILALVAAAALLAHRWLARDRALVLAAYERIAAWMLVALALVIAIPWLDVHDPQGLAFRLRIAAFVPRALCGAIVAGALARASRDKHAELALVAVAIAIAVATPRDRSEGRVIAHPALVAGAMAATHQIPPGATAIVPERHIAFMVAYYTRAPVSLRPEPVPRAQRVRILPLAFVVPDSPLEHALDAARAAPGVTPPVGLHPRYRNGLVLVTEDTWDWLLAQLPESDRRHFAAWPTI